MRGGACAGVRTVVLSPTTKSGIVEFHISLLHEWKRGRMTSMPRKVSPVLRHAYGRRWSGGTQFLKRSEEFFRMRCRDAWCP